jgi:hypothetical protein
VSAERVQRTPTPAPEVPGNRVASGVATSPASRAMRRASSVATAPVMTRPDSPSLRPVPATALEAAHDVPRGGVPLPVPIRRRLEASLGADLRGVRVHHGGDAARATANLSARAFAYGNHVFLGSGERVTDVGLLAHETAHMLQQRAVPALQLAVPRPSDPLEREAEQAASAVVRGESFTVRERVSHPRVQRLGIRDALDYFADRAHYIPGFRMFTIILGVNPINMSRVERSAANILRALIEFIPGGGLITQALDAHGVFDRVGAWVEGQVRTIGLTGGLIRQAIDRFLDSLRWRDIFDLGGVWNRAVRIFTEPIDRLISFGRGLVTGIVRFIKDAILRPLASLAEGTRGYDLLKAVLGRDPITGEAVPRSPEVLIGGLMRLIGQEEVWQNLQRARVVPRAWAWFQGALGGLLAYVRGIPQLFLSALQQLELGDLVILPRAFAKVARVFGGFVGSFFSWAGQQVLTLLQIIVEGVAPGVMPYLRRAAGAFRTIVQNPVGFLRNLVRAGVQGLRQFAGNFLSHLGRSLVEWLTGSLGSANLYIPRALNLPEIIRFVLSVLGLTWANVRGKLVRLIPEPAVRALESGLDLVVRLVRDGPAAAWEQIQQGIANLRDMVIGQITSFVTNRIVQSAITTLVTSLNPVGGFIRSVIAIYDTVMFFVERLRQIARVVAAVIDSLAAIASGNIGTAASRVEQTMAGMLTLVISFLARIARLGNVSEAVINIINRIRAPIDRALDRVVTWIVNLARSFLARWQRPAQRDGALAAPGTSAASTNVRDAARLALVQRLRSDHKRPHVEAVARQVLTQLRPQGLQRLELDPRARGSELSVIAQASDPAELLKLVPRGRAARMTARIRLAGDAPVLEGVTTRLGTQTVGGETTLIPAPLQPVTGRTAMGGLLVPPVEGSGEVRLVSWNTGDLDPKVQSNASHAERQFTEWFEAQPMNWRRRVRSIDVQINLSPCTFCASDLARIRRYAPGLEAASISYTQPYQQGPLASTPASIGSLRSSGWSVSGPPVTGTDDTDYVAPG